MATPPSPSRCYLDEPSVQRVLGEIFDAARRDAEVLDQARSVVAGWTAKPSYAQMSDLCREAALPVRPEVGRLLYMLVRMLPATRIVEFGTSFGASLIYLAAAVHDNAHGSVVGTEMSEHKIARANGNLAVTGLTEFVRIIQGDARESLAALDGPVDLLLLDGWKELYLEVLTVVEPKLHARSVVVADNLSMLPQDYLDHIRDPANGYVSISLPMGDGIEVSMRAAGPTSPRRS
jgi:predicted O-methyltransferase YrrM